jgi:hypothetical protein
VQHFLSNKLTLVALSGYVQRDVGEDEATKVRLQTPSSGPVHICAGAQLPEVQHGEENQRHDLPHQRQANQLTMARPELAGASSGLAMVRQTVRLSDQSPQSVLVWNDQCQLYGGRTCVPRFSTFLLQGPAPSSFKDSELQILTFLPVCERDRRIQPYPADPCHQLHPTKSPKELA